LIGLQSGGFQIDDDNQSGFARHIKTQLDQPSFTDKEINVVRNTVFGLAISAALLTATAHSNTTYAQSATVCDSYARNYSQNASRQGQVLGRGALGSLVGAGIGAAFGGAAIGAAIGGGLGLIGGGSKRQKTANRMYNAAYQDCMAGRVR